MSKLRLKHHLQSLTQKQVIDIVMQLYDAKKEAREWLNFYLQPDEAANFEATMKFLSRHNLIERFQPNLNNILRYTEHSGWGFEDDIRDIYYEYTD